MHYRGSSASSTIHWNTSTLTASGFNKCKLDWGDRRAAIQFSPVTCTQQEIKQNSTTRLSGSMWQLLHCIIEQHTKPISSQQFTRFFQPFTFSFPPLMLHWKKPERFCTGKWVELNVTLDIIRHFRDGSFQTIDCAGTDK